MVTRTHRGRDVKVLCVVWTLVLHFGEIDMARMRGRLKGEREIMDRQHPAVNEDDARVATISARYRTTRESETRAVFRSRRFTPDIHRHRDRAESRSLCDSASTPTTFHFRIVFSSRLCALSSLGF